MTKFERNLIFLLVIITKNILTYFMDINLYHPPNSYLIIKLNLLKIDKFVNQNIFSIKKGFRLKSGVSSLIKSFTLLKKHFTLNVDFVHLLNYSKR